MILRNNVSQRSIVPRRTMVRNYVRRDMDILIEWVSEINSQSWGQDYKEKHKTRLKTNVKRTMLNNTKLRHFWAQIVSWAPIHARKTFIILAPGVQTSFVHSSIILFYSVALLLAKSKSSDNLKIQTIVTSWHVLAELS